MSASKPSFLARPISIILASLAGPLIWAVHFAVVYVVQHTACTAFGGEQNGFWIHAVIIAATVLALLALIGVIAKPASVLRVGEYAAATKETQDFLLGMMQLLAMLSCFGVLWAGSAALWLPVCSSLA